MGLGAVEHLVVSAWNVAIFDFNGQAAARVAQKYGENVISIQGNAVLYEDQVKVFTEAWKKWQRINLGRPPILQPLFVEFQCPRTQREEITTLTEAYDLTSLCQCGRYSQPTESINPSCSHTATERALETRWDFCKPVAELDNGAPPQPDLLTIDVSLVSSIWSAYLALHFFRKNACKGGKLVFTSSSAGLYPSSEMLLYGAAKHGVRRQDNGSLARLLSVLIGHYFDTLWRGRSLHLLVVWVKDLLRDKIQSSPTPSVLAWSLRLSSAMHSGKLFPRRC